MTPANPFGEQVLVLFVNVIHRDKDVAEKLGTWLGINERTEEARIGTERSVVRCRTYNRFSDEDARAAKAIPGMKGSSP